jgi:predicted KAP-like P-loop ATPase
LTFGAVKGEVNVVDFVAMETLRVFCPSVYEVIRANPQAFALFADGIAQYGAPTSAYAELYSTLLAGLGALEPVIKKLVARLFPRLDRHWNNVVSHGNGPLLRKQLRICIPEHFPTYFKLARPEGTLSHARMKAVLERAGDSGAFGAELVELAQEIGPNGTSFVRQFLEWLQDYTDDEIVPAEIPHIISALFDVGDKLLRDDDRMPSLFDFGNEVRIGRVIRQLFLRLNERERFNVLADAVRRGQALATITSETVVWGQEHGKYRSQTNPPAVQRTLTADQLGQVEMIVLDKIRQSADDQLLVSRTRLPQILHLWHELAGGSEVKDWVKQAISEIEGLVPFVAGFAQHVISHTMGDVMAQRDLRLDPDWLEAYLDPGDMEAIADRLRRWVRLHKVQDRYLPAIKQFLGEWDARRQGESPSERRDSDDM